MRNPWVGLDLAADPTAWARLLRRAYDSALSGAAPPAIVREVVTRSWDRSRQAGVDPDRHDAPHVLDEDEVRGRWREHPLSRFSALVERMLCDFTHDSRHIVVISDAEGCLLWSAGHRAVLKASERIAFVPGRRWTESAAGTNGIGTALSIDHPVQIFSAEHFNREIHGWTCSGAPVHDPETGEILGVFDLSSGIRTAHPNSLALVVAAAEVAEAQLRIELTERDARMKSRYVERMTAAGRGPSALVSPSGRIIAASPPGWLPERIAPPAAEGGTVALRGGGEVDLEPLGRGDGFFVTQARRGRPAARAHMHVRMLGRDCAAVSHAGTVLKLGRRHSEIIALLVLRPDGVSSEQLALELYGAGAKRVSARAELARLRRILGPCCSQDPYRLTVDVSSDVQEVGRLLAAGRRDAALKLAPGPLLPGSRAPTIVAARERV